MTFYLILIGKEQNNYLENKKLNLLKIFLIPENKEELKKRLIKRNQNSMKK